MRAAITQRPILTRLAIDVLRCFVCGCDWFEDDNFHDEKWQSLKTRISSDPLAAIPGTLKSAGICSDSARLAGAMRLLS
jgi:hypothetical protein